MQDVAGVMVKLCINTFHEVYRQSFMYRGLQSGAGGVIQALMSHEQVVERLQEHSCSTVMSVSMMLSDATVTYRTLIGNDHDGLARVMVRSHIV